MAYDDRDYFRPKTRFDFGGPLGPVTKGMLIAFASAWLISLLWADTLSLIHPEYWQRVDAGEAQQVWAFRVFILTAGDIAPWAQNFSPGYWKLLIHWILPSSIISALISCVFIYLLGRRTEHAFGSGHFLLIFALSCVFGGAMAGIIDPLLMPGRERIVISGPSPGVLMLFTTLIWLAPGQRSIFGWPLRNVIIGVLAIVIAFNFLMPLFSSNPVTLSPTHLLWGPLFAWGYMSWLKSKDAVPSLASMESSTEPWAQGGFSTKEDRPSKAEIKGQKLLEKKRQEALAEKQRLDDILDKVARDGIGSLSRAEKKFLDRQSSKMREQEKQS
jgi:membrane associated rhomboid family serine protease